MEDENAVRWDNIYDAGDSYMWYPSELLVRLVRLEETRGGLAGIILDHGAGSGNNAEFLVRSGHQVHCTEISKAAAIAIRNRFRGALLPPPPISCLDTTMDLSQQLPKFDHVIAWLSLYYNTPAGLKQDLAALISRLPSGGTIIAAMIGPKDVAAQDSVPQDDGSRLIMREGRQKGCVVTVANSIGELQGWFEDVCPVEIASYQVALNGVWNDYLVFWGHKA